MADSNQN